MGIYNLNNKQPFEKYGGYKGEQIANIIEAISMEIVEGNCFAFVGAGVSMRSPSCLPNWTTFIEHMAAKFSQGTENTLLIQKYISRGDLITAAELIKRSNPTKKHEFAPEAAKFFQRVNSNDSRGKAETGRPVPNDIHRLITRTVFQKIITTNYDDLLNEAMRESRIIDHDELTRNEQNFETNKLINGLISTKPAIVKVHGTCGEPESMIITRDDYLKAYSGGYLINWLRTNLIQKSFLFVGFSLSDYDIVNLIKEARAALPKHAVFGRHFAILDGSETSEAHREYLKECYNIQTIVDDIRNNDKEVLRQVFTQLHGVCALKEAKEAKGEAFTIQPPIALRSTIHDICKSIRRAAGADYIALYMTEDIDRIKLFGVCLWAGPNEIQHFSYKPGHPGLDENPPSHDLKRMFLNMRDCNYYYSGQVDRKELIKFGIPEVDGRSMKSVLIIPVASQGKKIGLLVAGSVIERAFTQDHYDALAIHVRIIAESYKTLLRKLNTVRSAQAVSGYDEALSYLLKSRLLNSLLKRKKFNFFLYAIDYEKGLLIPRFPANMEKKPWRTLSYKDTFLATVALNSGATLHFKDRAEALHYMKEHKEVKDGLDYFEVQGNLYMTPIRSNGYISTILVCWNNSECEKLRYTQFVRAKRIIRVLFNDFRDGGGERPAIQFLDALDQSMRTVDGGKREIWKAALDNRQIPIIDQLVRSLLAPLVADVTRLTRVRLWVRTAPKDIDTLESVRSRVRAKKVGEPADVADLISFKICYSNANPAALPNGEQTLDKYLGRLSEADDEYTLNTLDRYSTDPYAREIDPFVDGILRQDKNASELDKDPEGSWLTVPLVHREREGGRRHRLLGFLSADDHRFDENLKKYQKPVKKPDTPAALVAFQRCVLDLVAHIVAPLIKAKYFDVAPGAK